MQEITRANKVYLSLHTVETHASNAGHNNSTVLFRQPRKGARTAHSSGYPGQTVGPSDMKCGMQDDEPSAFNRSNFHNGKVSTAHKARPRLDGKLKLQSESIVAKYASSF